MRWFRQNWGGGEHERLRFTPDGWCASVSPGDTETVVRTEFGKSSAQHLPEEATEE